MMESTQCQRCGGMIGRCECADIRREAFAEAAAWCEGEEAYWIAFNNGLPSVYAMTKASAYNFAAEKFRHLAAPPEPPL